MAKRNFTDEQEAEIARRYLSGESARNIARSLGLKHHISVCSALCRQGIEQRPAPERNRLYKLNPHVFDVIDSEAAAYWWGFVYADGCVHKRSLIVTLQQEDKGHLLLLKEFLQSQSPVGLRLGNNGRGKRISQSHVEFTDCHLANRMHDLGIIPRRPRFDLVKRNLPGQLQSHWIRGFFDGDGSARKANTSRGGSLVFCGQRELLEWMRAIFASEAGTNPNLSVTKCNHAEIYYYYISGRLQALKAAAYLYRNASIWLERKRQVVETWQVAPQPVERDAATGRWLPRSYLVPQTA